MPEAWLTRWNMLKPRMRALLYAHKRFLQGDPEGVRGDFRGLNLCRMDLRGLDLRGGNFSRVNFEGADLRGANLSGANLSGANLHTAKLKGTNLTEAILSRAFAAFVDFDGAVLARADLSGADFRGCQWNGSIWGDAKDTEVQVARVRVVPDGDVIGWKKLRGDRIAKLLIPRGARRSNGFSRRCRAEYVLVLAVFDKAGKAANSGTSKRDATLKYEVGKITKADGWDEDWANECSHGINFFITREEAEAYG